MKSRFQPFNRRGFIRGSAALGVLAGLQRIMPAYAFETTGLKASSVGDSEANGIDLLVREETLRFGERLGTAITINGTVPGPLVRLREGSDAILRFTNGLEKDTSVHWHGLLLPPGMDGVPGITPASLEFSSQPPSACLAFSLPRSEQRRSQLRRLRARTVNRLQDQQPPVRMSRQ